MTKTVGVTVVLNSQLAAIRADGCSVVEHYVRVLNDLDLYCLLATLDSNLYLKNSVK